MARPCTICSQGYNTYVKELLDKGYSKAETCRRATKKYMSPVTLRMLDSHLKKCPSNARVITSTRPNKIRKQLIEAREEVAKQEAALQTNLEKSEKMLAAIQSHWTDVMSLDTDVNELLALLSNNPDKAFEQLMKIHELKNKTMATIFKAKELEQKQQILNKKKNLAIVDIFALAADSTSQD